MATQTEVLAGQVEQGFGQHPDAEIYRSQPGLGVILGAQVLAEFGDDLGPLRRRQSAEELFRHITDHQSVRDEADRAGPLRPQPPPRRCTVSAGLRRTQQFPRRPRLLRPTARARGATHYQALRALANRLVGILHGCLRHHTLYDEHLAWHSETDKLSPAA